MVLDRWERSGFKNVVPAVLVDDQHVSTEACLVCDTSVRSPYYNFSRDVPLCQRLGVVAAMVSLLPSHTIQKTGNFLCLVSG